MYFKKKTIFLVILFGLICFNFSNRINANNILALDNLVNNMTSKRSDMEYEQQKIKYQTMIVFLDKAISQISIDKQIIAKYLQNAFAIKLIELENSNKEILLDYIIPNVDMQKVKDARLKRHNDVRIKKGLQTYKWNNKLEKTAHNRAQYLASINTSTHKRKSSDGYYNYNSIKDWFEEQGVYFLGTSTQFSESIAYNYYSCNKSDCTQDLINAIKKGFDFFMSEESYNGPHYRGVVNNYYSNMGMGIGIIGKRFYIVSHYSTDIK